MAWKISGTYVASCSCQLICGCPTDNPPTGPDGQCHGVGVFHIADGNLDDTDLSDVNVCLVNLFPSNLTAGNWKLGVVIDEGASDEQASAAERIFKGEEGGPFGDFAPLVSEWLGAERGAVTFSDGDRPTGSIGGVDLTFEPLAGPEGSNTQTTVKNAAFGFAPEYRVGKTSGHVSALGLEFDAIYGETADFEFASEMAEGAAPGRG
jgi:hypothetical protein